ncbi:MAG: response regulator transcription factor [Spirochaetales bacterium]|nr:response regulator transcription factor [Spirochaetales bacterium]
MSKIKVLIVDDHSLMRKGICGIINHQKDMEVVGEAADGLQAIKLAKERVPDVVLMDIVMPELNGIQAAKKIKQLVPMAHILFFSGYDDEKYISAVLKVDASGYLLKNSGGNMVLKAIRTISRGDSIMHPLIMDKMLKRLKPKRKRKEKKSNEKLSKREIQVVELGAKGLRNKEIAQYMGISPRTVHAHWNNIFKKLGARSRVEAIMESLESGLVLKNSIPKTRGDEE